MVCKHRSILEFIECWRLWEWRIGNRESGSLGGDNKKIILPPTLYYIVGVEEEGGTAG
jgi:hypothetical protein